MKSKPVALLMADLGVTKSHSRPRVSNDNPYSESQFKTLKYSPRFPENFGSIEHARSFCAEFFPWYNHEHHHSGLCLLTPAQVHAGQAEAVLAERHRVLLAAYEAHPERFVRGAPQLKALPKEVWINRPEQQPKLLLPSNNIHPAPASGELRAAASPHPSGGGGSAEPPKPELGPQPPSDQRSEPQTARRTRRSAGDVTGRNHQDQRPGAATAAGRGPTSVPLHETASAGHLSRIHPTGGVSIETSPGRH
jgi:hypothetical protein